MKSKPFEEKRGQIFCLLNIQRQVTVVYLEGPALWSGTPSQRRSWLYLSRNLMYLLQRWQSSVLLPHTSYNHEVTWTWHTGLFDSSSQYHIFRNTEKLPDAQPNQLRAAGTRRIHKWRSFEGSFLLYEQLKCHVPSSHCTTNKKPAPARGPWTNSGNIRAKHRNIEHKSWSAFSIYL